MPLKWQKMSQEQKDKISKSHMGYKHSEEAKIKMGQTKKANWFVPWSKWKKLWPAWNKWKPATRVMWEKSHTWKWGITPINEKIRKSIEYKLRRDAVFKRDNYSCVFCWVKGWNLNADHIKPFYLYPELRFDEDNGRTLCVPCHRSTPTYGRQCFTKA